MEVTDDERRRVAERLRWLRDSDLPPWVGYTYEVVMGYMPKVGESSAYHESSYKEYVARLADLIDPDTTTDTTTDTTKTAEDTTKTAEDTTKAPTSSDAAPTSSHPNLGTEEVGTSQVPECDTSATHTDASATCDVSQVRRGTVACDPTGRGLDSIYEWCRERLEGADGDEDELYCAIMRAIEEYRRPELVTAKTARPVDRDALLALAGTLEEFDRPEMDDCTRCPVERADECGTGSTCQNMARWCARRIREACGVVA